MATPGSNPPNPNPADDEARVGRIEAEALAFKNILNLKREINRAAEEELNIQKTLVKLSAEEVANAGKYRDATEEVKQLEKEIEERKHTASKNTLRRLNEELRLEQQKAADALKTTGGALMQQQIQARKQKEALTAEKKLIEGINKERGVGAKLMDMFRSKEAKQRSIDLARAKAGGGVNTGPAAAGSEASKGKTTGGIIAGALGITGLIAGIGLLKSKMAGLFSGLMGPLKGIGGALQSALVSPLNSAAKLMGGGIGMGGGAVTGEGATSILGGLSGMIKTIPFVGGLLGGLVDIFKSMLDAVLGVETANFRVGRSLNISAGAAEQMRTQFDGIAAASGNIVVNSTRMLQSQIDISKQLGTNKQLSADILVNDVKLRDILGLEAESRQQIAEASIVTGRNATKLTQGIIGTVGAFNKLVGTSFKFNDIVGEASKLTGVLGLTFAKFPEKITKAVLATKTLGFELKQLDGTADSFLDFESSISKEMEAQVLTGKELNLTAAREAALNNDYATLSQEITKNVGSTAEYLNMNRIQQEAIAQSVGMTRDGLADVLKKQTLYAKLGATDVETFNKKISLLEKQGKTQEQISALIGKDAYNSYTQVSTAEKLTEVMERIKKAFVDFMRKSGLFDFLSDPKKIDDFIKGLANKLASTVNMIGSIIATLIDGVGSVVGFFGGDKDKYQMMAAQIRSGAGSLAGGIQAVGNSLGGTQAASISSNVQQGAQQQAKQGTQQVPQNYVTTNQQPMVANLYLDGQQITTAVFNNANSNPSLNFK